MRSNKNLHLIMWEEKRVQRFLIYASVPLTFYITKNFL